MGKPQIALHRLARFMNQPVHRIRRHILGPEPTDLVPEQGCRAGPTDAFGQ
ncbi:hypothetical protein CVCC1112_2648 [Paenarthrobacter nicotinovorans]|nr:hypothetical protein CVCC1112_2648 [Paenarthrobacter nicotinovorans]